METDYDLDYRTRKTVEDGRMLSVHYWTAHMLEMGIF